VRLRGGKTAEIRAGEGVEFVVSVRRWAAWAPGLPSAERWSAWAAAPWLPSGDEVPAVAELPAMQRRRLTRLGRMALQVAWDCQGCDAADLGFPLIFASRYGDVERSLELLRGLDADNELSPTGFGMSVHNAVSGMYSIARGDVSPAVCVAAGASSAGAGLIEAAGLLADGAREVMLVAYDEPLPSPYESFADERACYWAWAWRLAALPQAGDTARLRVQLSTHAPAGAEEALPFGLALLRASLDEKAPLSRHVDGRHWQVERVRELGHA